MKIIYSLLFAIMCFSMTGCIVAAYDEPEPYDTVYVGGYWYGGVWIAPRYERRYYYNHYRVYHREYHHR